MFSEAAKPRTNWSGFMQHVFSENDCPITKSEVLFLPIIDLSPSDETCIYSTLLYIQIQAEQLSIPTACITFDQPLWRKAVEIITERSLRLGGFHTMMSFLGSIGSMMKGSGLEEALEQVYGPNAVAHMMTGKAVSRALRGHFLVESALLNKLMLAITPNKSMESEKMTNTSDDSDTYADCDNKPDLCKYMCDTLKIFIRAERIGDWNLHLIAIGKMLNLFAATGHIDYAKSSRLYLQLMMQLPSDYPWLYQ